MKQNLSSKARSRLSNQEILCHKPKDSLQYTQKSDIRRIYGRNESTPNPQIRYDFFNVRFNIILPSLLRTPK
jgi:hypothetical protein